MAADDIQIAILLIAYVAGFSFSYGSMRSKFLSMDSKLGRLDEAIHNGLSEKTARIDQTVAIMAKSMRGMNGLSERMSTIEAVCKERHDAQK